MQIEAVKSYVEIEETLQNVKNNNKVVAFLQNEIESRVASLVFGVTNAAKTVVSGSALAIEEFCAVFILQNPKRLYNVGAALVTAVTLSTSLVFAGIIGAFKPSKGVECAKAVDAFFTKHKALIMPQQATNRDCSILQARMLCPVRGLRIGLNYTVMMFAAIFECPFKDFNTQEIKDNFNFIFKAISYGFNGIKARDETSRAMLGLA